MGCSREGTLDISAELVTQGLGTQFVGQRVLYYPSTSSTQDRVREAAKDGAPEGTIAIADEQTAGRGRLRRRWVTPPASSIAVSILLRPRPEELPRLSMVAALAVVEAVEEVAGVKPALKWPNDIMVAGKKLGGILIESEVGHEGLPSAIVGIGINVNMDLSAFPEIAATATSLSMALGRPVSRLALLQALLRHLEGYYLALRRGEPVPRQWAANLETIGQQVQAKMGEVVMEGVAEGVDEDGRLLLRRSDGSLTRLVAGEVTLKV